MRGGTEAAELRVLSGIIALALDEQPGQAAAALDALRRRAAASGVTGGALRTLYERLTVGDTTPPAASRGAERPAWQRLQQDLDVAMVQGSRLAAENGALRHRLAEAERRLEQLARQDHERRRHAVTAAATLRMPHPPARHVGGVLAGAALGLLAMLLAADHGHGAAPNRHGRVAVLARAAAP